MKTLLTQARGLPAFYSQAYHQGIAEATVIAFEGSERLLATKKRRAATLLALAATVFGAPAANAHAQSINPGTGCGNTSTNAVVSLIGRIATFLLIVGLAISIICLFGAALMYMLSANKSERADKAMKWAKNTVIGLAILAGAGFVRFVVVDLVENSSTAAAGAGTGVGAGSKVNC